jgi:hypothetical protein
MTTEGARLRDLLCEAYYEAGPPRFDESIGERIDRMLATEPGQAMLAIEQRVAVLEAVYDWVSRSHGNFPMEHDHHCKEVPCTCGWTDAEIALSVLYQQEVAALAGAPDEGRSE